MHASVSVSATVMTAAGVIEVTHAPRSRADDYR